MNQKNNVRKPIAVASAARKPMAVALAAMVMMTSAATNVFAEDPPAVVNPTDPTEEPTTPTDPTETPTDPADAPTVTELSGEVAATALSGDYKLVDDVTLIGTLSVTDIATIDLNGFTLNLPATDVIGLDVTAGTTLTIKDTGTTKGKVVGKNIAGLAQPINVSGTLVWDGAAFVDEAGFAGDATNSARLVSICTNPNGILNLQSSSLETKIGTTLVKVDKGATFVMNGGSIKSSGAITPNAGAATSAKFNGTPVVVENYGTTKLNKGTVTGAVWSTANNADYTTNGVTIGTTNGADANVTVNGALVVGNMENCPVATDRQPTLTVNSGTVNADIIWSTGNYNGVTDTNGKLDIKNGKVTIKSVNLPAGITDGQIAIAADTEVVLGAATIADNKLTNTTLAKALKDNENVTNSEGKVVTVAEDGTVAEKVEAKLYTVSVVENIKNGKVTVEPATAKVGDEVAITITPDKGYVLDTLTVLGGTTAIEVKDNKFKMPENNVIINATFKQAVVEIKSATIKDGDVTITGKLPVGAQLVTSKTDRNSTSFNLNVALIDANKDPIKFDTKTMDATLIVTLDEKFAKASSLYVYSVADSMSRAASDSTYTAVRSTASGGVISFKISALGTYTISTVELDVDGQYKDAEEIEEAKKALDKYITGLTVNTSKCDEAMKTKYTNTIKDVKKLLKNKEATLEEVEKASDNLKALVKSIEDLNKAVTEKDALQKLINQKYEAAKYTAASYKAYTNAIKNAKAVIADKDATLAEVTTAKNALNTAIKGLVKVTPKPETTNNGQSNNTPKPSKPTGDHNPPTGVVDNTMSLSITASISSALAGILSVFNFKKRKKEDK